MPPSTELFHGKHVVRVGQLSGRWVARAFYRDAKLRGGIVAEASADTRDDALSAVVALLDSAAAERRAARRHDAVSGFDVPSAAEFAVALQRSSLAAAQVAMLKAHAAAGEGGLTAGELATAAGYTDFSAANAHYGKCGRSLADTLDVRAPAAVTRDGDVPTAVMARAGESRPGGEFVWVMYPELREAVGKVLA